MSDIDLSAIRARLASASGPTFWRSLDEVAETPEFQQYLQREFPENAAEWSDPAGRRQFLKLMGASLALAGATACTRQPTEHIVPYVVPPEGYVPGKTQLFATAVPRDGVAEPVLAVSHHGRPIKIEPNAEHPAGGGTSRFAQASILELYDPDRSQTLTFRGEIRSWTDFVGAMAGALSAAQSNGGAGLRFLTGTVTSPTIASQLETILGIYPQARWIQYEPVGGDDVAGALGAAYGQRVAPVLKLENADVILSLDGDFMDSGAAELRYARTFAERRRLEAGGTTMNRLYMVESRTSNTGTKADHRVAVRAADVDAVARAVAAGLGVAGATAGSLPAKVTAEWVSAVVADLKAAGAKALVVAGEQQTPAVQVLAAAMNQALGAIGSTVDYIPSPAARVDGRTGTLTELVGDMSAGKVEVLVILGGNPVYDAPVDLGFADQLKKVAVRVHAGLFKDETAARCEWHVPLAHPLEAWGDLRAYDGTVTIVQPLIAPLYDTAKAPSEVLAAFGDNPAATALETLRAYWEGQFGGGSLTAPDGAAFASFDKFWRRAVHDGFVYGTAATAATIGAPSSIPAAPAAVAADALEVTFSADPTVHDGRYANNAWLQELPKPLNKITWDNVIVVSPRTAERLGLPAQRLTKYQAAVATVTLNGRSVSGPVWVQAGHPDNSVNLQLGYGRTHAGRVGTGIGYDAYRIRRSTTPWFATGVKVENTGDTYTVASTQMHFNMEQRAVVRSAPLPLYKAEPTFAQHMTHVPKYEDTLHGNEWQYDGYKWGMVIDLNACDGCNACVVACVSENNIPVVGKTQVATGREMHWLRIDRYYEGDLDSPTVHDQPLTCMQCENAPCEVVCPVAATVHSQEGLNDMVYNRCVGTRYCANNCPYKVRRFNFLLYADWDTTTLKMARNPEVTVRSRGVMEKCTYCTQRISAARITAKLEDRRVRDGEIKTACQSACPTQAITFGDLNDPESRVAKLRAEPRNYGLLEDLNTRPRTTYLAAVRNPNPVLSPEAAQVPAHGSGGHGEPSPSKSDEHGKAATAGAATH
ncbi:MAG TPA: TAT-variant-translocated molybdopterin oxidoreductase [Luteitalea sp.]|nr:TAT-variant-translocated molybdopterin oxidoreductase [Luteitalea sp.]